MLTELLILPTALHSRLFIFHVTDEQAKGGEVNSMATYHSLQVAEVGHKLRLESTPKEIGKKLILSAEITRLPLATWARKNNEKNFRTSTLKSSLKICKLEQLHHYQPNDVLVFIRIFCLEWLTSNDSITQLHQIANSSYT